VSHKQILMTIKALPPASEWVYGRSEAGQADRGRKGDRYTARLTTDITPELRHRLKIYAISHRVTVAAVVREVLELVFADEQESSQ
jgi:hypothetical protein